MAKRAKTESPADSTEQLSKTVADKGVNSTKSPSPAAKKVIKSPGSPRFSYRRGEATEPVDDPVLLYFGKQVLEARRRNGWTQKYVAERAGLNSLTITLVEAGRQNMTISRLKLIAAAIGLEVSELFPPRAHLATDERAVEVAKAGRVLVERFQTHAKRLTGYAETLQALVDQFDALMREIGSFRDD